MRFKVAYLQDELAAAHSKLRDLLLWTDGYADDRFARDLLITCVARTLEEQRRLYAGVPPAQIPKSPHCTNPTRAADVSVRGFSTQEQATIEDVINRAWSYDHERPGMRCAKIHKAGLSGVLHLHLQVHDNTTLRGDSHA